MTFEAVCNYNDTRSFTWLKDTMVEGATSTETRTRLDSNDRQTNSVRGGYLCSAFACSIQSFDLMCIIDMSVLKKNAPSSAFSIHVQHEVLSTLACASSVGSDVNSTTTVGGDRVSD